MNNVSTCLVALTMITACHGSRANGNAESLTRTPMLFEIDRSPGEGIRYVWGDESDMVRYDAPSCSPCTL